MWIIVGLGNPGIEYECTRHNVGREAVMYFREKHSFPSFVSSSEYSALISEGEIHGEKVMLILPETFMNASGKSVKKAVKKLEGTSSIVIYDDVDIGLGNVKVSFNRGSGGHKGIESIIDVTQNKEFCRIRIGICPIGPSGELKKPKAGEEFDNFVLGKWKIYEEETIKEMKALSSEIASEVLSKGVQFAMDKYNTSDYGKNATKTERSDA